ncbi:MAG: D-alanine--D-alanine ligase [Clostridiales bacterium]|nr:D-alanine--D-alanine ligase [Candidatus Apopatousia equi]
MKKTVCVIFGGVSTEHDISILSAMQVIENLDKTKYEILPIYITKKGEWLCGDELKNVKTFKNFDEKKFKKVAILPSSDWLYIKKISGYKKYKKVDCAFVIMHGMNGEDGTIQGLLELSNIPYTSSGIFGSSVGMDKLRQKMMLESLDLNIVPYTYITKTDYEKLDKRNLVDKMAFPLIVKPNKLGSSIGISVCKNNKELKSALDLGFKFDDICLIEEYVKNKKEVNISVLGYNGEIMLSETEEPIDKKEFLDFNEKYLSGKNGGKVSGTKIKKEKRENSETKKCGKLGGLKDLSRKMPAEIDEKSKKIIEQYAREIFVMLDLKGVVRIDFIIDTKEDKVFVNEVNTIPGSMAFYLWEAKGIKFKKELDMLYDYAIKENIEKNKKIYTFDSKIL